MNSDHYVLIQHGQTAMFWGRDNQPTHDLNLAQRFWQKEGILAAQELEGAECIDISEVHKMYHYTGFVWIAN
jgi:hypothetical protein